MAKIKNIVFLLFIISLTANAQVAGYLGKRFIIGYSNYFMFGPKGPGPNTSGTKSDFSPTLNNVSCLNLEYIYKQRRSVCFAVQYMNTGIAYDDGISSGYPYPNQTKYSGDFTVPATLRSINLALGFKMFKHGTIAPAGGYQKLELLFMMETVDYDNKHFSGYDYSGSYSTPIPVSQNGTGEYTYKNFVLGYTIGKQRILFDRLVFDYGIRFAIAPAVVSEILNDGVYASMEDYYMAQSRERIFREQLINVHLGFGFLAF